MGKGPCVQCGGSDRRLNGNCRPCTNEASHRWRNANPRKVHGPGQKRQGYALEKRRASNRRAAKMFRKVHPERSAYHIRKWCVRNREKIAAAQSERFVVLREGSVTRAELGGLGNRCAYCSKIVATVCEPLHATGFDHVIPISRGGLHELINLVVCCLRCNSKKGARYVAYMSSLS